MAAKNKNIKFSDSEYEHDAEDCGSALNLPLEKLNIGPRKKLLVMNLNGFLLHRVHRRSKEQMPEFRRPDGRHGNFLVFKRPFSEEFMKFCLQRFEVGIWSSAMRHNIDDALYSAIGTSKSKLLFVWDQERCTNSRYDSIENDSKPLFFKELNQVWEKVEKGGPFSASNTLLIDDKPYRAFLNPPNTAIFPEPYNVDNDADRALDPKGELCLFLEGVCEARDVQSYVKDHPFGQAPITQSHPDWEFYSGVKKCIIKIRENKGSEGFDGDNDRQ